MFLFDIGVPYRQLKAMKIYDISIESNVLLEQCGSNQVSSRHKSPKTRRSLNKMILELSGNIIDNFRAMSLY